MTIENKNVVPIIGVILCTALALGLRVWGLAFGLPVAESRPDEMLIVSAAMGYGTGDFNPHFFNYPSLFSYVVFVFYGAYVVLLKLTGSISSVGDVLARFAENPTVFFLIPRCLSALFGAATVSALFVLARKCFGIRSTSVASSSSSATWSPSKVRTFFSKLLLLSSVFLLVIGDVYMRKKIEKQARDLGIADSVAFLGSRPHEEVALWMNVADCLCLPSRSEGMPNVVSEALASGLPVVATDVGAVPELLRGEPGGRTVERHGAERMAHGAGSRAQRAWRMAEEAEGRAQGAEGRAEEAERSASDAMRHAPCAMPFAEPLPARLAAGMADMLATPVDRPAMAERQRKRRTWFGVASEMVKLMQGAGS